MFFRIKYVDKADIFNFKTSHFQYIPYLSVHCVQR
jgi:hypothetical protein